MTARIITGTVGVFLTAYSDIGPKELATAEDARLVGGFQFWSPKNTPTGWTLIGSADVHVTLKSNDEIILGKVDALKAEKASILADAQRHATKLDEQIQNLLAISYEPA